MPRQPNKGKYVTKERAIRGQREPRVQRIARMMAEGVWFSGPSHAALSTEYGVGVEAIMQDAKEASKLVRFLAASDPDELREQIRLGLERARQMGEEDRDPRACIAALDSMARLLGLQSVKVDVTLSQLQVLPRAELARRIRDTIAGLQNALSALESPDQPQPAAILTEGQTVEAVEEQETTP